VKDDKAITESYTQEINQFKSRFNSFEIEVNQKNEKTADLQKQIKAIRDSLSEIKY
jgi:predicted  nucleic acid-binding Zn-ribbon protein